MITKFIWTLSGLPKELFKQDIAYKLYSALMQRLPKDFADTLHRQGYGSISQYVMLNTFGYLEWRLVLLGEVPNELKNILQSNEPIFLEKYGIELKPVSLSVDSVSEARLCEQYLTEVMNVSRQIKLQFVSPTAFKSGGEYVFMPTKELILQSLVNKWNSFATQILIDDDDCIKGILEHVKISYYHLKTVNYQIKGVKIPGFSGKLTLSANGPEAFIRIFHLLCVFAQYSGVGIKTALGMGGVVILE